MPHENTVERELYEPFEAPAPPSPSPTPSSPTIEAPQGGAPSSPSQTDEHPLDAYYAIQSFYAELDHGSAEFMRFWGQDAGLDAYVAATAPRYRLWGKVVLDFGNGPQLIDPMKWDMAQRRFVPTEIVWMGEPNHAMEPLTDSACEAYAKFIRRCGTYEPPRHLVTIAGSYDLDLESVEGLYERCAPLPSGGRFARVLYDHPTSQPVYRAAHPIRNRNRPYAA